MMKLSLGSQAFVFAPYAAEPVPLERVIDRLWEAEFDGIDLAGYEPHATLERYPNASARTELRQRLADRGLGVSGYAADFSMANPAVEGNKENYIDLFHRAVDFCVEVGSPSIRVDTVASPSSIPEWAHLEAFERVADTWTDAAEIAARSKVRMLWQFEPRFLFNKPAEILAMRKQVSHPNFKILFDTADAYICAGGKQAPRGGVPGFLKKLEDSVGAVHIIDCDGTLHHHEASTRRPFGEGFIDFNLLAPLLLDVTGVDWWTIDLAYIPGAWELIESSRDFVLDLLDSKVAA